MFLLGVSVFFTLLICMLVLFYGVRYRQGAKVNRTIRAFNPLALELTWSLIPLGIMLGAFAWGADVFYQLREPPADTMDVYVVAKQWMWKFQHPGGKREINTLHIPQGRPVRLIMASEDVIHSFFVPNFRTKMDVLPGRYTTMWFEATKTGSYHLFCAEYCGTGHSRMIGRIEVLSPSEFERWLSVSSDTGEPRLSGAALYQRYRCGSCHKRGPDSRSPPLEGIFGKQVRLADGGEVTADAQYLRESILNPNAKISANYRPVMPTYQGQISEEELFRLIDYLKTLQETPREEDSNANTDTGS